MFPRRRFARQACCQRFGYINKIARVHLSKRYGENSGDISNLSPTSQPASGLGVADYELGLCFTIENNTAHLLDVVSGSNNFVGRKLSNKLTRLLIDHRNDRSV